MGSGVRSLRKIPGAAEARWAVEKCDEKLSPGACLFWSFVACAQLSETRSHITSSPAHQLTTIGETPRHYSHTPSLSPTFTSPRGRSRANY